MSLAEATTSALVDRMVDLAGVADLFEVRGDFLLEMDLLTPLRARVRPLLFTCRPEWAGGRYHGDEERRRLLLLEAVRRGYDYVDVELEARMLDVCMEKSGNGLVVSHHDLEGTPSDLRSLYQRCAERGADVVKLAVTPRTIGDVARVLELADALKGMRPPLVAVAMGTLGMVTRILAGRLDAPFTLASSASGAETAPGQITATELAEVYRVRELTKETAVYALLGGDVSHSLSPRLHNRAFQAAGIDAVYVPLSADRLEGVLDRRAAFPLAGFGVTRPFKVEMADRVQELEPAAALARTVNTVEIRDGRLHGSSTDGEGVVIPLRRHLDLRDRTAVVLGAGGAARAAAHALLDQGATVKVLARDAAQAQAVGGALDCGHGSLSSLQFLTWDVLVNATPTGSGALVDQTLVPAFLHKPGSVVFDMVYEPAETRLLREARAAGCVTIGGREMLVAQAEAQFQRWTGQPAPAGVMAAAAQGLRAGDE